MNRWEYLGITKNEIKAAALVGFAIGIVLGMLT
jgi:hypothetical protein